LRLDPIALRHDLANVIIERRLCAGGRWRYQQRESQEHNAT
jgi:hypothetical protein